MTSKTADSKLPKDEEELKRIVDLIPHHIVVLDGAGTAIFVNQQVLEACAWIFGSYTEFPFSFTKVCAELGVSPDRRGTQAG